MTEDEARVLDVAKQWAHQIRENIAGRGDHASDQHSLRIPRAALLHEDLLVATWKLLDEHPA